MKVSVVIPTYNRKLILQKCLFSLENQRLHSLITDYEIIVVDDGSTDGTYQWIKDNEAKLPHVVLLEQQHGGPAAGRNLGVINSQNEIIVFIDSDLIVVEDFLFHHVSKLCEYWKINNKKCFTYGSVINTSNFSNPKEEKYKITDISFAYFATGNVAISKDLLLKAGLFDTSFSLYGWEDLELGERLKNFNTKLIKCPEAIGYHWHPPFNYEQIPSLVKKESERAKMAMIFFNKHRNTRVRMIIQFTILHKIFWEIVCLGGLINTQTLLPILKILIKFGKNNFALELLRLSLNHIYVNELYKLSRN